VEFPRPVQICRFAGKNCRVIGSLAARDDATLCERRRLVSANLGVF
jgi:hypothetical protein